MPVYVREYAKAAKNLCGAHQRRGQQKPRTGLDAGRGVIHR